RCRAAETFTSEQNVRCYLRTHRICYPPDYRQLAERGLAPRKIRSIVGCSHSVPPRRQAADVIGARDVLALLIPDRRAVGVGLNGPYYIHRDLPMRSEERRVGKECRSGWGTGH